MSNHQSGMTLMEVMIALTIFAVFIAAFMTSQGGNINRSLTMREEVKLKGLAEEVISNLVIKPPPLKDSLTLSPEIKTFENDPRYEYKVEFFRFELPDLSAITGEGEGEGEEKANNNQGQAALAGQIYKKIEKALKEMLWQVRVTVTNKETKFSYDLTTWLYHHEAKIEISYP